MYPPSPHALGCLGVFVIFFWGQLFVYFVLFCGGCPVVVCCVWYGGGMTIPVVSSGVDLSLLHPRFVARLEAFFADDRIVGRVKVVSGCRSYAQQKRFYDLYKAGKGNLAANPDRKHGDGGWWRGSYHMEQADGFCYAVDFRITGGGLRTWEVNNVAAEYGLVKTVSSEWWHHQPRNSKGWFDAPALDGEVVKEPKQDLKAIGEYVDALGRQVARKALRYRSRGDAVKVLQQRLGALGFDAGSADGVFGRKTRKQVKAFQRVERVATDGIVGKATWGRLFNPKHA